MRTYRQNAFLKEKTRVLTLYMDSNEDFSENLLKIDKKKSSYNRFKNKAVPNMYFTVCPSTLWLVKRGTEINKYWIWKVYKTRRTCSRILGRARYFNKYLLHALSKRKIQQTISFKGGETKVTVKFVSANNILNVHFESNILNNLKLKAFMKVS